MTARRIPDVPRATDERQLAILDCAARDGGRAARDRYGLTNSALQGLRARMNNAALAIPCTCTRLENRDGGMPPGWWRR